MMRLIEFRGVRLAFAVMVPLAVWGCGESVTPTTTSVPTTPAEVLEPAAPAPKEASAEAAKSASEAKAASEAKPVEAPKSVEPVKPAEPAKSAEPVKPAEPPKSAEPTAAVGAGPVELKQVTFEEYLKGVKAPGKKLTIVDAWATWCAPCKENFPHLVEMHKKYGDQGLNAVSLSMDDPSDADAVGAARKFLESKGATFTNFLLKEEFGKGFERFDINAIPAVFLYDAEGKEVRRFTLDDPKRQFTYAEVEEVVGKLLKGEALPEGAAGSPPPGAK